MNAVIVYSSRTGFTERYARWICDAARCDCIPIEQARRLDVSKYETVIFGSWMRAGKIVRLSWLKKRLPSLGGKSCIVFAVGGSPHVPQVDAALKANFTDSEWRQVKAFYCPGGLNYEKMPPLSRLVMRLLARALKSKKNASQQELEMAQRISSSYDISDEKNISPILMAL